MHEFKEGGGLMQLYCIFNCLGKQTAENCSWFTEVKKESTS